MNKMNKKGFTLIEMLVVIAIIAILVSIIVPVVGNSTVKAAAATNAANLRAVVAEVTIKYLEDPVNFTFGQGGTVEATNGELSFGSRQNPVKVKAPAAKAVKIGIIEVEKGEQMTVKLVNNQITATYDNVTIEQFADIADDGKITNNTKN